MPNDVPDDERPESCPAWCIANHDEIEDDNRRHVSRTALVPGIALVSRRQDGTGPWTDAIGASGAAIDLPGGEAAVGITISVAMHARDDSPMTWVYIGDGGRSGCEISGETASLVIDAVKELLSEL
ncbi:hypothetical protein H7J87_15395 [Mycolicibacterium wolinskyi]|uniref:Uncharacterized protein n=1 Tax=Mycolicibacterium wolinskyi TaxID=59750 RepID=A0A1X2F9D6_9MYCO|nr:MULTISPECIES: hypothetical protein [Mycolicibacterium]MCV7286712.1 hypothetical protein [Mycolicibacterium wolinskyi]MCV7293692.1 hypothetical protein [Mycolicibacterium goodii]ORX14589.1 hypothetical protein AWC31_25745 [Mycolicibacterium wolinskyi]